MRRKTLFAAMLTAGLAAGCSSTPERIDLLEDARMAIADAEQMPRVEQIAGAELEEARQAVARADRALDDDHDVVAARHDAYLALRHAQIVEERVEEAMIREQIDDSKAERTAILLEAREMDAGRAAALAQSYAIEADRANAEADLARAEAEQAKSQAASALAEAQRLEAELEVLQAEETERGMVLTLGDVLFDTDRAELKPGADQTMNRLAAFLSDFPERHLLIEGHTDDRGDASYNERLSERRANAVKVALIERGIDADRMLVRGLGEAYPVATNNTSAGRQENRRVEVVVSDDEGDFPPLAHRGM